MSSMQHEDNNTLALETYRSDHSGNNTLDQPENGDSMSLPPLQTNSDLQGMDNKVWPGDRAEMARNVNVAGNPKKMQLDSGQRIVAAGSTNAAFPNADGPNIKIYDYNMHSTKKSVSSALLDVALLMANASQLKSVYMHGPDTPLFVLQVTLLIVSIIAQIVIGLILIFLGRININDADDKKHNQADLLNNVLVVLIFLLTLTNVFISAIGINVE